MALPRQQVQYGMEDLLQTMFDLFLRGGDPMSNLVFGRPDKPEQYDVAASSARKRMADAIKEYRKPITYDPSNSRHRAIAAVTGVQGVKDLLDLGNTWAPEFAEMITGHFGSGEAVSTIIGSSVPMAMARGGRIGGFQDPLTTHRNINAATKEGGAVYKTLFRSDGTVNTDITYGLGLPEMGKIISGVLSDKNIRGNWARDAAAKDKVSPEEAENLKNGVDQSEKALNSFGEYTKNMVTEVSRLVSSMNKVTGDYDKTIGFLQRITNGELMNTGKKAEESRRRASTLTTNMRLAAADAGMSIGEMYMSAEYFTKAGIQALGMGDVEEARGGSAPFSYLGGIAAIANANWKKMNPNASKEEQKSSMMAIGDAMAGYMGSDMDQMNALAAKLAAGGMNMKEYERNLQTGDAEKARQILIGMVGRDRFSNYMSTPGLAWLDRRDYQEQYSKYAGISIGTGRTNETIRVGGERMLGNLFSDMSGMLTSGVGEDKNASAMDMENEMWNAYKDQLTSTENLRYGGLKEGQITRFQEWAKDKSPAEISDQLNRWYGTKAGDMIRHKAGRGMLDITDKKISENVMGKEDEEKAIASLMDNSELKSLLGEDYNEFRDATKGKSFSEIQQLLTGYLPGQEDKVQSLMLKASGGKISGNAQEMKEDIRRKLNIISPEIDLDKARRDIVIDQKNSEMRKKFSGAISDESSLEKVLEEASTGDKMAFSGDAYLSSLADQINGTTDEKALAKAKEAYRNALQNGEGVYDAEKAFSEALGAVHVNIDPAMRKDAMKKVLEKTKNKKTGKFDDWAAVGSALGTSITITGPITDYEKQQVSEEDAYTRAEQTARGKDIEGTALIGGNAADPTNVNATIEMWNKMRMNPAVWNSLSPEEQNFVEKQLQEGDKTTARDRNKSALELGESTKEVLAGAAKAAKEDSAILENLMEKSFGGGTPLEKIKETDEYKGLLEKYSEQTLDTAIKSSSRKTNGERATIARGAIEAAYIQKHMGEDGSLEGGVIKILNSIYLLLFNSVKGNGGS